MDFWKYFKVGVVIPEISREKPATLSHLTFRPQGHLKKEVDGRGVHLCAVTPPLGTTLSPHIGATLVGKTVIVPIWLRPLQTRAGLIPEIATLSGKSCLKKTITALKTPIWCMYVWVISLLLILSAPPYLSAGLPWGKCPPTPFSWVLLKVSSC